MATKPKNERWTENRVFGLLKGPFPDGAYVRIPQVRNGTGYVGRVRTCDALIVSCWPSRGLWFAGVEIKVRPDDWKRELAKPEKSAAIQKWCDYWYVAAPEGIVPIGEVPPTWGLIECSARGCKIVRPAPKLESTPPNAAFICSVLRQATAGTTPTAEVESMVETRAEALAKSRAYDMKHLQETVNTFRQETGINIYDRWNYGDISRALELVKKAKERGIKYMAKSMKQQAEAMIRSGNDIVALCDEALADPDSEEIIAPCAVDG